MVDSDASKLHAPQMDQAGTFILWPHCLNPETGYGQRHSRLNTTTAQRAWEAFCRGQVGDGTDLGQQKSFPATALLEGLLPWAFDFYFLNLIYRSKMFHRDFQRMSLGPSFLPLLHLQMYSIITTVRKDQWGKPHSSKEDSSGLQMLC